MTKTTWECHSERSEESRVLIGRIITVVLLSHHITRTHTTALGIFPRPKVQSEEPIKSSGSFRMT